MSIDARLNRLTPALSARERGLLVLRAWKEKTAQDPAWRETMPPGQTAEFNRLIDAMNVANHQFAFLITILEKEAEKLELKVSWHFCLRLWQVNLAEINVAASIVAREAITASEYRTRLADADAEYVSVANLAYDLV